MDMARSYVSSGVEIKNISSLNHLTTAPAINTLPSSAYLGLFSVLPAAIESHFSHTGYELLYTSAKTGTGVDKLKEILKGKTSILTGPSGVGKSSLINNIFPHADMETGGMSKIGRGKHTTRHSEIFEVDDDTFILDTPGFTSMDLPDINKENVAAYFPEFVRLLGKCRFDSCIHIGEPGCAVKEALANGDISQGRYDSYVRFCEDIDRKKKY